MWNSLCLSTEFVNFLHVRCPCGFHSMACFLMFEFAFLNVCPILSSSICVFWWLLTPVVVWSSFTSTLLMISDHFTTRMFLRHLFTWTDFIDGFRGWLCFSQDFRFVYKQWLNVGVRFSKLCACSKCLVHVLTFSMPHDVQVKNNS